MNGEIKEGHIYELPFDGSDAHAEIIERTTGLTFLGDSTDEFAEERPCHMSGTPTKRRVFAARRASTVSMLSWLSLRGSVASVRSASAGCWAQRTAVGGDAPG